MNINSKHILALKDAAMLSLVWKLELKWHSVYHLRSSSISTFDTHTADTVLAVTRYHNDRWSQWFTQTAYSVKPQQTITQLLRCVCVTEPRFLREILLVIVMVGFQRYPLFWSNLNVRPLCTNKLNWFFWRPAMSLNTPIHKIHTSTTQKNTWCRWCIPRPGWGRFSKVK